MNGILIVDKPLGKTSFDMVRDVRKKYNIKKVGHIGTLDPMATGVLAILIGEATKLSDYLVEHDKEYIATLCMGEKRDTGDSEGKIIEEKPAPGNLSKENLTEILYSFKGESMQIPPMYSAIKINGEKLYDLARKGIKVERKPRKINIYDIELLEFNGKEIKFRVVCSKGTYIRSLCEDIAEKLNTLGYMKELKRTRIGNFKIEDTGKFIDLENALEFIEGTNFERKDKTITKINLNDEDYKKIINGVKFETDKKEGLVNLYYNNKFIGIGEIAKGNLKRKIIIN